MHYNIIISSNDYQNNNSNYLVSNIPIYLKSDCECIINNEIITFDYLIFTDILLVNNIKEIGVLTENKVPVTNYFKQTSIENIYYCKNENINDIINDL